MNNYNYGDLSLILKIYVLIIAFIFGAVFASGLTCLSWRLTHNQKWTKGKSHCDTCGHELKAKDLIPIISWLSTKGKCRYCGAKLSASMVGGEILLAIITMLLPIRFGISVDLIKYLIFIYLLFCIALCDLYSFEIPDRFWIIGTICFVLFIPFSGDWKSELIQGISGGVIIALAVFLISLLMSKILGKDAMGFGDIKLLFMTGLYLGVLGNLLTLIMSCILGLVLSRILTKNAVEDDEVPEGAFPFGPAISLAAMICVFVGEPLIQMYLGLFSL